MTPKKALLISLRLFFVVFTFQFINKAFYNWDGISYYMEFVDFIPELSLAFILWTVLGAIIVLILWSVIFGLFKALPKLRIPATLDLLIVWGLSWYIFSVSLWPWYKSSFLEGSISYMTRFSVFSRCALFLIIVAALMAVVAALLHKHVEKILGKLDAYVKPLVVLFTLTLVLAIPASLFTSVDVASEVISEGVNDSHISVGADSDTLAPNIIVIVLDALSTKDMQLYGYELETTPFITEWAREAAVFNRLYSSSNWTTPATMTLLTGQRVWTHGIWYYAKFNPLDIYVNNLPRVLSDNGYATYAYVQNYNAHPDVLGMGDAFFSNDKEYTFWIESGWWFDKVGDIFIERRIVREWIFEKNIFAEAINMFRPHAYKTMKPSEIVYNSFFENISHAAQTNILESKPFFAYLHLWPPHDPYLPPEPYMGLLGNAEKFNTDSKQNESGLFYKEYEAERQAEVDNLRKRYDESIIYSDRQFESFLLRLAEIVDMSNTIIILTSDHGESFTKGFQGHLGPHLYEALVNIPLVVKLPAELSGKMIDMPIDQIDIAPTVLELAGVAVPEWMEGRSLVPLLEGKEIKPETVFSMQFLKNRALGHKITKGTIAVWDRDYKLVYYLNDNKKLLYNLRSDPGETINILSEEPQIARALTEIIEEYLSEANKSKTRIP